MAIFPLGGAPGVTNAQGFSVVLAAFRHGDLGFSEEPTPLGRGSRAPNPPTWTRRRSGTSPRARACTSTATWRRIRACRCSSPSGSRWSRRASRRSSRLTRTSGAGWRASSRLRGPTRSTRISRRRARRSTGAPAPGVTEQPATTPEKRVPVDVVGTDALRARSIPRAFRAFMAESWLTRFGEVDVELDPEGYVAPPLDGIWASAPYFHNGSVPTLWHVLHPEDRPAVWRRVGGGYDAERVGLSSRSAIDRPRPRPRGAARVGRHHARGPFGGGASLPGAPHRGGAARAARVPEDPLRAQASRRSRSRSKISPPFERSPSCSNSLVTHARAPRIRSAVRRERSVGTNMSSW